MERKCNRIVLALLQKPCMGVRLLLSVHRRKSRESCRPGDGRAWEVDGRAQALVGPGLATPL